MEEKRMYCNPVTFTDHKRHTNPDPYVLRWCGRYYCYATDEFGVKVSVSEDLVHWEDKGYAIREEKFHHYWAPAVIYLQGRFYMYYSNTEVTEEDCHEEHLKLAVSDQPEGEFIYRKTFFDKFSIDAHPILWKGRLFMFYSVNDWIGTDEKVAGTCILLDEMKSPEEFAGSPKAVVLPGIRQEIYAENRFGDGRDWYTIEGAATVVRGDRFFLLYSANAYVNVDYYVGTAVAQCRGNLCDMVWEKYPKAYSWHPLLHKNAFVEGTGHNTVTKAPNMVDDWIVYHGRDAKEALLPEIEQRQMYIDPLYFDGDEIWCFGPTAKEQEAPALPKLQIRDRVFQEKEILGKGGLFYQMELWITAKRSHVGARFGILAAYQDEQNYLEIQIRTGRSEVLSVSVRDGIRSLSVIDRLPAGFDYTVPHLFRITRSFEEFTVVVDEERESRFVQSGYEEDVEIGIVPYFTEVTLCSLALTQTVTLCGRQLREFGNLYKVSPSEAAEDGLVSLQGKMCLEQREGEESYTGMFRFLIMEEENRIELCKGAEVLTLAKEKAAEFCLYHMVRGKEERFLIDGQERKLSRQEKEITQFTLYGLKIAEYQYTKMKK